LSLERAALAVTIGITFVCLGLTVYILKRRMPPIRRLFYFDLARYTIRILIVGPLVMPALRSVEPLIFNRRNLNLPPPGIATLSDWLVWLLGMPLTEFTQVDASLAADIFAVLRRSSAGIYPFMLVGMVFILVLDFYWAYRGSRTAAKIRTIHYAIMLLLFILWTFIAITISPNVPGAQDLYHRWLFIQYWYSTPWIVALVVAEIFFSFWLPMAVIGCLIYKQYLHARPPR